MNSSHAFNKGRRLRARNSYHEAKESIDRNLEPVGYCEACLDGRKISSLFHKLLVRRDHENCEIRIITEITDSNLTDVKKFKDLPGVQIKHIDGIKTNFALINGYLQVGDTISSPIHAGFDTGNFKGWVEAYQFFFKHMWNGAIPVDFKIEHMKRNLPIEKTDVLYGQDNILKAFLHDLKDVKERFDSCADFTGPTLFVSAPIWSDYSKLQGKGIRMRFITEITNDNIKDCKKLMKVCELRHLDKVKGNFGIIDGRSYGAGSSPKIGEAPTQAIRSTVRTFVEQQQYSFESLWNKAVPALQKIEQIQMGLEEEFINTLNDPYEVQKLAYELVNNSKDEIMVLFSTANAFLRQISAGSVKLLEQMALNYGVKIRVLTISNEEILNFVSRYGRGQYKDLLKIRYLKGDIQTRISLLLTDRKYSLAVELKDDTKKSSIEAIGFGTYSNSKATVLSYCSIFETLWRQSELYKQLEELNEELRLRDVAQQEFINTAAHELRTPIQPILGLSEIVLKKNKDESLEEELSIITRNAERLLRLTNNILDVTKIESKTLKLNKGTVNLDNLISTLVAEINTELELRRVRKGSSGHPMRVKYKCFSHGDPVTVEADRDRISQVLNNLLSNALNSSRTILVDSEEQLHVEVSLEKDNSSSMVVISVRDRGTGIDKSINDKLFTKFITTSDGGTGLGLFVSRNLVKAHRGRIWGYNNPDGVGATFCFSIPFNVGGARKD